MTKNMNQKTLGGFKEWNADSGVDFIFLKQIKNNELFWFLRMIGEIKT